MLTDPKLRTASRDDLTALRSLIFEELARRDREGEPEVTQSMVVESRPHADGLLLLEKRIFTQKIGGPPKVRGQYWTSGTSCAGILSPTRRPRNGRPIPRNCAAWRAATRRSLSKGRRRQAFF